MEFQVTFNIQSYVKHCWNLQTLVYNYLETAPYVFVTTRWVMHSSVQLIRQSFRFPLRLSRCIAKSRNFTQTLELRL